MQRIGRALHINSNKNIILKAENLPRIGDRVVDKSCKPVGMIFDVFGPSASPYVAVKPKIRETRGLIDHVLFAAPTSKPKQEKKGKKNSSSETF